jgi:hypothetical protein
VNDDSDDPARPSSPKTAFSSADPPRNFSLSVGERIRAMTIGVPAHAARKRHIEDLEAAHIATLVALHDALVARARSEAAVKDALHDKAATFDLKKLNALVATHNRYYAIEANLPVNPRTGEYLIYGRPWRPDTPWTVDRIVDLAVAAVDARREL